ncbi:Methyltransferase domain-containing protein [Palleronia salina]|uniref:Methyltransferase domain-containing protein n=1 Tax=Palleronia salina TaxID=313368 RepID=A0A1M6E7M3_9RHOB|nr:class I SAM-dependent methyltransferase [Palleronia salina]SHI81496.1 Methyltransferase domain-containing protein [Palleronia salina]
MTKKTKVTFEQVEKKRRDFARTLKEFRTGGGRYHHPAQELPAEKYEGCEVLPNRMKLIDKLSKGGTVAEIGVDRGDFSLELLTRLEPKRLHLFDIDITRLVNPEIRANLADGSDRVTTHIGDRSTNMRKMPDDYFDVIYIDGDHTYEGVMRDIEASLPKVKKDGVLVFNDYAVWSAATMFHCGVARAVNELALNHPWKFRYLAMQPMMYNDAALVREDAG